MTSALEGDEWSAVPPGRTLPTGKTRYPLYRRLGGPQGLSGQAENIVPIGIRSRTFQLVVSSLYRLSYRAHVLFISGRTKCLSREDLCSCLVLQLQSVVYLKQ